MAISFDASLNKVTHLSLFFPLRIETLLRCAAVCLSRYSMARGAPILRPPAQGRALVSPVPRVGPCIARPRPQLIEGKGFECVGSQRRAPV
jgi:hypothetical protein